jgi:hypothetical protein
MQSGGNIDRRLTDEEAKASARAVAAVIRELAAHPQEVTTYALATLIEAMAANCSERESGEAEIMRKIQDLLSIRP